MSKMIEIFKRKIFTLKTYTLVSINNNINYYNTS